MKLYHRYVCIGKNILHIGFGIITGFKHPLGVKEYISTDEGGFECVSRA